MSLEINNNRNQKPCQLILKPVTSENIKEIEKLQVAKGQEGFIETPRACLEEAGECPNWRPVGIYNRETLVGFAMYGYFKEDNKVWMDRLLIDKQYQGLGYGKTALKLLIQQLVREYACKKIYLSVYDDNSVAIKLYESFGFLMNGEKDTKGEDIMVLTLT